MTAIIKKSLGYAIADSIISDIRSNSSRYYYFLGKSVSEIPNEVPLVDSHGFESQSRNEITLMRKITPSDVSHVIPRIDWTPNTVFEMYTSLGVSSEIKYYCVNSEFNVYKCLDNKGGSPSLYEPTSVTTDPFYLADGYKWKFMYNIPLALRNKFTTSEYIPVLKSLNNRFFSNGSIQSLNIIDSGSGYTQNTTTVVIQGNGVGAKVDPVISNGQLVDLVIVNAGYGYTFANVEIESTRAGITPAVVTVDLSLGDINSPQALTEMLAVPGTIDSISITEQGVDYTTANVLITGDGSGAAATALITAGKITGIVITNPGSNYTQALATISGDGVGATLSANISPLLGHGRNVVEEFCSNTLMFYQNLSRQKVGTIFIDNDFSQYGIIRNPLNKNFGNNITDQSNSKAFGVKCQFSAGTAVSNFTVGAAVYIIKDSVQKDFVITQITVGTSGAGMILSGDGTDIENNMEVFLTTDPTKSFFAQNSMKQTVVDVPLANTCYTVSGLTDTIPFTVDSLVINTNNNKEFRVISVDAVNKKLLLMPLSNGTIVNGNTINKKDSLVNFVASDVIEPNVDRRTGDILFIENRLPINQTDDQSVTFRTVLQF